MTTLYIAGQQVALPDNFTLNIVEENPFFTKSGKYTYDIELSLLNPINQRIYQHINRFNFSSNIPTNRQAILIVDNKVELNGTEVILFISKNKVKIQLVSGNSELNYLVGGDQKIREMNLGEITVSSVLASGPDIIYAPHLADYLNESYPDKHFNLVPFIAEDKSIICNNYQYTSVIAEEPPYTPTYLSSVYRPLPYFNYILKKIINSLGYSFPENPFVTDTRFNNLFIIHGYITLEYAKMLPDWTVNEFLSNIEKQFDLTFLVDEKTKIVTLKFNSDAFDSENVQEIEAVDFFETDIVDNNKITVQNGNLAYDLDDYVVYNYSRLSKDVKDYSIAATYTNQADLLAKVRNTSDTDRFKKIFSGPLGDYIAQNGSTVYAKKVDFFKDLIQNDKETIDIQFKILPAPMAKSQELITWAPSFYYFYAQMPIAIQTESSATESGEFELNDLVTGDEELKTITLQDKMYLAIYTGLQTNQYVPGSEYTEENIGFPISATEDICEYFDGEAAKLRYFMTAGFNPFRLQWLKDNFYNTGNIDTSKTIRITFRKKDDLNIIYPMIASGKKMICLKYQKFIDKNGYKELCEGEFYEIE